MILDDLIEHTQALAKANGVIIKYNPNIICPMMYTDSIPPYIEVPPIDNNFHFLLRKPQAKYLVTLHEIGHCFHKHTLGLGVNKDDIYYFTNGVLKSEAEAWRYAIDNSIVEITPYLKKFIYLCISTYIESAILQEQRLTHNPEVLITDWNLKAEEFLNLMKYIDKP